MSDSSTFDKVVVETPEKAKPGRKPTKDLPVTFDLIHVPEPKMKYETKFTCFQCTFEVKLHGHFYVKPYCAKCHVEMRRDKR